MAESHFVTLRAERQGDEAEVAEVSGFALELARFEMQLRDLLATKRLMPGSGLQSPKS